jgi:hypothetical protein
MDAQRTEAWFQQRVGKLTASRFADVMNVLKNGEPGANRRNLVTLLAVERLTGATVDTFQNDAMRRGTELEPEARAAYEAHTGELVEEVGFVPHPQLDYCGVSPDGLLGRDGLVELKCPASMAKHLDALRVVRSRRRIPLAVAGPVVGDRPAVGRCRQLRPAFPRTPPPRDRPRAARRKGHR